MAVNLTQITTFGSSGSGNTQLSSPAGVAFDGRNILIADSGNHRILKWANGGNYVDDFGSYGTGDLNLDTPMGIYIYRKILLVCDSGNSCIKVLRRRDFKYLTKFGASELGSPQDLVIVDGYIYITCATNDKVFRYSTTDFSYVDSFCSSGSSFGSLQSPKGICYNRFDKVFYVVSAGTTKRVDRFDSNFNFRSRIMEADSVDRSFTGISSVFHLGHYIYLLEANRIQIFDEGNLATITNAGTDGSGSDNISDGEYIYVNNDFIILSDAGNDRIAVWNNYNSERNVSSGDDYVIGGDFFFEEAIDDDDDAIGSNTIEWTEEDNNIFNLGWEDED